MTPPQCPEIKHHTWAQKLWLRLKHGWYNARCYHYSGHQQLHDPTERAYSHENLMGERW